MTIDGMTMGDMKTAMRDKKNRARKTSGSILWSSAWMAGLIMTGAWAPLHAQDTTEVDVKAAVRAAWDLYIDAFSAGQTDVIARKVYAAPSFQLGNDSANVRGTEADTKASFDATHQALSEASYDRSETDRAEICVINNGTALLSAYFTRYRTDDTVLTTGASSYLFAKFPTGWRIVAIMANPDAKLITCD
jgi:hypothetical protein